MTEPKRIRYNTRQEWLDGRLNGIGASEAAACVGLSPWQTASELWEIKTGRKKPKDISDSPAVKRGVRMEPVLRELFRAMHPDLVVEYHEYDVLFQDERPWMFATLDGEILLQNGERGILEIKTAGITSKARAAEWEGGIPKYYHAQLLHQLNATKYAFAVLFAGLLDGDGGMQIKSYELDAEDCAEDRAWLASEEANMWKHIQNGTLPPQRLVLG